MFTNLAIEQGPHIVWLFPLQEFQPGIWDEGELGIAQSLQVVTYLSSRGAVLLSIFRN